MQRFWNAALIAAALIAPMAIVSCHQHCEPKIKKPRASTTTNNTTTIMNGTTMKIRRIVSGQKTTIANTAIFPSLKTTINKHIGAGVTSIQTPSSRLT